MVRSAELDALAVCAAAVAQPKPWSMLVVHLPGVGIGAPTERWVLCRQLEILLYRGAVPGAPILKELRRLGLMAQVRHLTSLCRAGLSVPQFEALLVRYSAFRAALGEPPALHIPLVSVALATTIARTHGVLAYVDRCIHRAVVIYAAPAPTTRKRARDDRDPAAGLARPRNLESLKKLAIKAF